MKRPFTSLENEVTLPHLKHLNTLVAFEQNVVSTERLSVNLINREGLHKLGLLVKDSFSFMGKKIKDLFSGTPRAKRESMLSYGFSKTFGDKVSYLDLTAIQVPVPEGMRVTYLEFINFIIDSQQHTQRLYDDFLTPFNEWLAQCINRPEMLSSISAEISITLTDQLETYRNNLGKILVGTVSARPYGEVIKRQADWDDIEKKLLDISQVEKQQPRELIIKKVQDVQENLTTLMTLLNNSNSHHQPTKKVIKDLADTVFALADNVAYYAIVESMIDSLLYNIAQTKETIKKEAKKIK